MLTLVLGGARSGKSRYAQSIAAAAEGPVLFIATSRPVSSDEDPEMAERIARHRSERPAHWRTVEAPLDVVAAIPPTGGLVLIDCVTLWISNLLSEHRALERGPREERIVGEIESLAAALAAKEAIAVSNEVGEGVVPENPVAREFRDLQGRANQILARAAFRVVLLVAGIPMTVKG